ncbi:MAG: cytochrome B [Anaerorhabdus sp.]
MENKRVQSLTRIAIMASIQSVVFLIFSQVLYLEGITFVVCLFACAFEKDEAVFASFIFGVVNMLLQGATIWTMMYILIYPSYSFIVGNWKYTLLNKPMLLVALCGVLSFLTGQLLELPFLLFSTKATIFYLVMGLKTSLIQGCLSAILCLLLFDPCYDVLKKIEGRLK